MSSADGGLSARTLERVVRSTSGGSGGGGSGATGYEAIRSNNGSNVDDEDERSTASGGGGGGEGGSGGDGSNVARDIPDDPAVMMQQFVALLNKMRSVKGPKSQEINSLIRGVASNKRKLAQTTVVNMRVFVAQLERACQFLVENRPIAAWSMLGGGSGGGYGFRRVDAVASTSGSSTVPNVEARRETTSSSSSSRDPELVLNALTKLFALYETEKYQFQFSREQFKFFMATYSRYLQPEDFVAYSGRGIVGVENVVVDASDGFDNGTGSGGGASANSGVAGSRYAASTNGNRRQRTNVPLGPGQILGEYAKGPEVFVGNVYRADRDDVEAITLLFKHRLTLPMSLYSPIIATTDVPLPKIRHVCEHVEFDPARHARIPVNSLKRNVYLVTQHVVLVRDKDHFAVPVQNVEKDIATATMSRLRDFGPDAYVMLDVIVPNKVLDVLAFRRTADPSFRLPDKYVDRLRLIEHTFPGLRVVSLNAETIGSASRGGGGGGGNGTGGKFGAADGYLQKDLLGPPDSEMILYTRPYPTGLIVGIHDKLMYAAFLLTDTQVPTLFVETKFSISGPTAQHVMCAELQDPLASDNTILYDGVAYRLLNAQNQLRLLVTGIPVEIRDGTKLSNLNYGRPISTINEYNEPRLSSTVVRNINASAALMDTSNFTDYLVNMVQKLGNRDEVLRLLSAQTEMTAPVDEYE